MIGEEHSWPERIEGFVLDLDGTIYRGDQPILGAFEALRQFKEADVPMVFMTNNSTRTRQDFADKLTEMGFETNEEQVINTAYAAGRFVQERFPAGCKTLVVGAESLADSIAQSGCVLVEDSADVVVVGLDRTFTYDKLCRAVDSIRKGATFIMTNPDRLLPEGDSLVPGAGTMLAAIEVAVRDVCEPIIVGKPNDYMPLLALELLGTRAGNTVAVGDQVMTDVAAGQAAGMFTVLAETGVPVANGGTIRPHRRIRSLLEIPV